MLGRWLFGKWRAFRRRYQFSLYHDRSHYIRQLGIMYYTEAPRREGEPISFRELNIAMPRNSWSWSIRRRGDREVAALEGGPPRRRGEFVDVVGFVTGDDEYDYLSPYPYDADDDEWNWDNWR